jgi:RimJ/RimL family protein N-acetyltransferase
MSAEVRLKDGTAVTIRDMCDSDTARMYLDFIAPIVREKAYILLERVPTYSEEQSWLRECRRKIRQKSLIQLLAIHDGRIVGNVTAERGNLKNRNNVVLGIAISRPFRGMGLGEVLMERIIARVKDEMRPRNIHLNVFAKNVPAIRLYTKLGFRIVAKLKDWVYHQNRFMDEYFMILRV